MVKSFLLFSFICYTAGTVIAQNKNPEADLKAVFIYNFTRYIEWEVNGGENDFIIGVIGTSPVTASLNDIAKFNKVNNKNIVIRVFDKTDDIENCQILFISKNLPYSLSSVMARVQKGMLTVGEEEGYASRGTAFNFLLVNNKLKFEANLKSIASTGLKVSSQLLKLAIIIQ